MSSEEEKAALAATAADVTSDVDADGVVDDEEEIEQKEGQQQENNDIVEDTNKHIQQQSASAVEVDEEGPKAGSSGEASAEATTAAEADSNIVSAAAEAAAPSSSSDSMMVVDSPQSKNSVGAPQQQQQQQQQQPSPPPLSLPNMNNNQQQQHPATHHHPHTPHQLPTVGGGGPSTGAGQAPPAPSHQPPVHHQQQHPHHHHHAQQQQQHNHHHHPGGVPPPPHSTQPPTTAAAPGGHHPHPGGPQLHPQQQHYLHQQQQAINRPSSRNAYPPPPQQHLPPHHHNQQQQQQHYANGTSQAPSTSSTYPLDGSSDPRAGRPPVAVDGGKSMIPNGSGHHVRPGGDDQMDGVHHSHHPPPSHSSQHPQQQHHPGHLPASQQQHQSLHPPPGLVKAGSPESPSLQNQVVSSSSAAVAAASHHHTQGPSPPHHPTPHEQQPPPHPHQQHPHHPHHPTSGGPPQSLHLTSSSSMRPPPHAPTPNPPPQSLPPSSSSSSKLSVYDLADKIKDEFGVLEMRASDMIKDRNELHAHYAKHWEMAYQLNAEVHKQLDINSRYQAIINQLLPMLTANVQSGVRQDMESIKGISDSPLPNPPAAPPIILSEPRETVSSQQDLLDKRPRGRPSKARLEQLKVEAHKRMRMDAGGDMEGPTSVTNSPAFRPVNTPHITEVIPPPSQHLQPPPPVQHGGPHPPNPYRTGPQPPNSHTPPPQRPPIARMTEPAIPKTAVPRGVQLAAILPHGEVVCALALSHPFQHVFTGGRGVVKIWDVSNVRESRKGVNVGTLDCLDNYIRACHITRDSKTMIVAGEARYMVVCDIGSSNPIVTGRLQTPNQLTYALSASKDSRTCFSCCSDGSVNMWDLRTMSLVKTFEGHEDSVTCCCLTPDGQKLITGSLDKTVRVWDINEGREHCKYNFPAQIFSLGVCPMQPIIAVGLETSVVDVRYLSNFDLNQELHLHDSCVLGLKYAPSGSWFITSGKDHKWISWKSTNCETLFQQMENASILSCDISRDGKYVVTGSGENNAHVYEVLY